MNRERAKELLPIIQAFAEGKEIQSNVKSSKWTDVLDIDPDSLDNFWTAWRIKPEPREFWIVREKQPIDNSGEWYSYRPSISVHQNCEAIHVREVLDD